MGHWDISNSRLVNGSHVVDLFFAEQPVRIGVAYQTVFQYLIHNAEDNDTYCELDGVHTVAELRFGYALNMKRIAYMSDVPGELRPYPMNVRPIIGKDDFGGTKIENWRF